MNKIIVKKPGPVTSWLLEQSTRVAEVTAVEVVEKNLRLVELTGEQLRGAAWAPGDMVQLVLSGAALLGPWEMRSYTPLSFDTDKGTMEILAVLHGHTPGSNWFETARIGARCRFVGPKFVLSPPKPERLMVFFGDETSFGTAIAFGATWPGYAGIHFIFEVGSEERARAVLRRFGLTEASFVVRNPDDGHLDALERHVIDLAAAAPQFVLTGRAPSIQHLYKALRAAGVSGKHVRNVPYWAPGKTGLKGH